MRRERRVQTLDAIRQALIRHHATSGSWRSTGAFYGVSPGLAQRVAVHGYEPRTVANRNRLGLPPNVSLHMAGNNIWVYEGSQVGVSTRFCRCGQPFIPNAATRIHCFICAPSRARRRP